MVKTPAEEIAKRIVDLQSLLQANGVDAAVIRQNADLYYFTGTVQDAHLVVPASGRPAFLVRREVDRALEQSPVRPVIPLRSVRDLPGLVLDACESRVARLGFELDVLPANSFFFYDEKLFPKQQIVDVSGLIRQVRMVKSAWEIGMMRKAAAISRIVADSVPELLREGVPELDLSAELEMVARKAGHLGIHRLRAFNMDMFFGHVLSGPEAATPSYSDAPTGGPGLSAAFGQGPGERLIRRGEVVSIDTMCNYNGYLNDQTRNFSIGDPSPKLAEAYGFIREAHQKFRDLARPGHIAGELYSTMVRWADEAGYAEYFMGCGKSRVSFVAHGIGIEVDEFPFIAQGQKLALQEGMTFALEPKIIIPGLGIAGLENTYVLTSNGPESLNTATEEMVIL